MGRGGGEVAAAAHDHQPDSSTRRRYISDNYCKTLIIRMKGYIHVILFLRFDSSCSIILSLENIGKEFIFVCL